jgi:hypothetical protein
VPASFQWLLSIIGFVADRARGLEELRLAVQANGSRCTHTAKHTRTHARDVASVQTRLTRNPPQRH